VTLGARRPKDLVGVCPGFVTTVGVVPVFVELEAFLPERVFVAIWENQFESRKRSRELV
jgi:hypothetical protein